ncbi:MAG: UbiA family prenyltransferase [Nitrospirae bacterium]|nr:UbiA family prenyltransferase [Nitrospirota bacterium]
MKMIKKIEDFMRMIKFSHSIFALPFAFTGALIAAEGLPTLKQIFWITVAMVSARSGAMSLNRIIDRKFDALNPMAKRREIPSGIIKVRDAYIFTVLSFGLLSLAAYMLNPLCLKLTPIAIAVIYFYSYTKRFTWTSHFVLGLALSAAPFGAWIAVRGTLDISIITLGIAVVFWLAGFDTLYALQDVGFDKSHGLHSIPQRFGIKKALLFARLFHLVTWLFLVLTGIVFDMGLLYWIGMAIVAALFVHEHSLVKADDLSKLDIAFFNMNGYISITVFVFTLMSYLLG